MKKTILVSSTALLILIAGLTAFYQINKNVKFIDLSQIHVETDGQLSSDKVKIRKGFYTINRKNVQQELFEDNNGRIVFDGSQVALLETEYGENDFIITYDDRYYFQFRHYLFNRRYQHTYNFSFYRKGDQIKVRGEIEGRFGIDMKFDEPMNSISMAGQLRCNGPIDSTKTLYNMIGLQKPSH